MRLSRDLVNKKCVLFLCTHLDINTVYLNLSSVYLYQQESYLGGGSSIDDGLHEDAEVGVVLLGAIPFDADAESGGTRVAEGYLEGQELSGPVWSEDQVVLLGLLL